MSTLLTPQPLDPRARLTQPEIERLLSLLREARLPEKEIVPDAGWGYGIALQRLRELKEWWVGEWDWRGWLDEVCQWKHYTVPIEGIDLHFVHVRSSKPNAIPLLMSHGWPGSFYEFHKVIGPLSEPESADHPAFDVVVPSLPGFGFSGPPPRKGWTLVDTARVYNTLMTQVLGYKQYVAQGGDWGYVVTRSLTAYHGENCALAHFNNLIELPPTHHYPLLAAMHYLPSSLGRRVGGLVLTEQEMDSLERQMRFRTKGMGYYAIQSTRPSTLGYALHDNPLGLLSWIGEKYHVWTDPVVPACTNSEIINTVALYHLTGTFTTSALPYYENRQEVFMHLPRQTRGKAGVSVFRFDVLGAPRSWAERSLNVKFWRYHEKGGHFAALEMPEALTTDVREFVRANWQKRDEVLARL